MLALAEAHQLVPAEIEVQRRIMRRSSSARA
jgi:hypothetical protein